MRNKRAVKYPALWQRALALGCLSELSPALVESWAHQMGLGPCEVLERDVGAFRPTPCVVIRCETGSACLPTISAVHDKGWLAAKQARERTAQLWEKLDWFVPLWVPMCDVAELLTEAETRPKEHADKLFNHHMSTVYGLAFQAMCIAQVMPASRSLAKFAPLAREAFLAFCSGHRASSIAALMPVMEGAIRDMAEMHGRTSLLSAIDVVVRKACDRAADEYFDSAWAPCEYRTIDYLFAQDERVFVFESFRRWLTKSFFQETGQYDGTSWLNRHLFAHGSASKWHNSANFKRLVVALATLAAIESWHDGTNRVSLLWPEMNADSKLLWHQALVQVATQTATKQLEQKVYQENGQLVPNMPTDDGVRGRAAHLQHRCMEDLVRPLRRAGWSVDVSEPDDRALYVTVEASSGDAKLRVALLFSCATDNEIYQQLAHGADAVLYLGAPLYQSQFARGVEVHVGPLLGWQPPQARGSARTATT